MKSTVAGQACVANPGKTITYERSRPPVLMFSWEEKANVTGGVRGVEKGSGNGRHNPICLLVTGSLVVPLRYKIHVHGWEQNSSWSTPQCLDFGKPAFVAFGIVEVGFKKGLDQFPGEHIPGHFPTQTTDIHVVILDALAG